MACVIFDLDGTLADTSRDLIAAANACFRGLGLGDVLDPVADAATALRGGRAMLALGFQRTESHDPAEIDRQYPVLLDAYGRDLDRHTVLYPGAIAAVRRLRAAGIADRHLHQQARGAGRGTDAPPGRARRFRRAGRRRHAAGAQARSRTLSRGGRAAPAARSARSLLVGDTVTDRDTARAAGVPSVLVTFGPLGGSVADLAPEGLIGHFDELWDEVRRLLA